MRTKAYVIDTYSEGSYHEVINQGYLMMIAELYDEVVYVAERASCQNLKKLMKSCGFDFSNVMFEEKKPLKRVAITCSRTIDRLLHLLHVSFLSYYYYLRTARNSDVFFNNNLYFAIPLIHFFSFWKKGKVVDMCHNEMEQIDPTLIKGNVGKILHVFFYVCFKMLNLSSKFKFLLLSSDMMEYFKRFVHPRNYVNVGWIDHCYIRPPTKYVETRRLVGELKVGIPGFIALGRGLPELKEVLSLFSRDKSMLYAIGRVSENLENDRFVALNQSSELMPFDLYNSYIQQMDVLMLCYTPGSYKLTASGAVLEAIWNEKPVLAIENEYFKYLFKKFGALGILAKDAKSLAKSLNDFSKKDVPLYIENLRKAKMYLCPNKVKEQLQRELKYDT